LERLDQILERLDYICGGFIDMALEGLFESVAKRFLVVHPHK
jgi:hypothetical protein